MNTKQNRKKILITGGTKGIGYSLSKKFASQGFDIATCARSADDLNQWSEEISQQYNVETLISQLDLSDKLAVIRWAKEILEEWKSIDVFINNAAIYSPGDILSEPEDYLEYLMQVNVFSPYEICRVIVPAMIDRGSGHVFNISSIAALTPVKNGGAYAITKYAMTGLSKVLREELRITQVKVTTVFPGATLSASWDGIDIDHNRLIDPDDVASGVWAAYQMGGRSVVEDLVIRPMRGDL